MSLVSSVRLLSQGEGGGMFGKELPDNAAVAHVVTVRDLRKHGQRLAEGDDQRGASSELLAYTTGMANPLARISISEGWPLNTLGAVARFVWLLAGSDRLEDIAYYEPRVRSYTDDGLTVPGSSYGKRLFNSAPGTDQIAGVVKELKNNPASRRAAAVVWLPEDAVRKSNDIPCTFGLFFHVREGGLVMTTVMRSNNAVTLLPYNFFEFSMLGEIVAAELDVPFVRYVHWAASMHIFDQMSAAGDKLSDIKTPEALEMPTMPRGDALRQGFLLAEFEAKLRHAGSIDEAQELAVSARAKLGPYWSALFDVLLSYGLAKRGDRTGALTVVESLPSYFRAGASKPINDVLGPAKVEASSTEDALFSLADLELLNKPGSAALVAEAPFKAGSGGIEWLLDVLKGLTTSEHPVTLEEVLAVKDALVRDDLTLAARDSDKPTELSAHDVAVALEAIRRKRGSS